MPFVDTALFEVLNRGTSNALFDALFPVLTSLHQNKAAVAVALVVCLLLLVKGSRTTRIALLCLALSVGAADLVASKVIKRLVRRDRPCRVVAGHFACPTVRLAPRSDCPGSGSFPSNHAANTMAFGLVAWAAMRRSRRPGMRRAAWGWFLLPLLLGYTRVYLGYHYPSDVLAGWLLGLLTGGIGIALLVRWAPPGDATAD